MHFRNARDCIPKGTPLQPRSFRILIIWLLFALSGGEYLLFIMFKPNRTMSLETKNFIVYVVLGSLDITLKFSSVVTILSRSSGCYY